MQETYRVKYRSVGSFFWSRAKLSADLNMLKEGIPVRVLIRADGARIELPMDKFEFIFCKKRLTVILKNMERESGQKLNVEGIPT